MEINNYKIISGRIIGEEKNERGLNAVYNIADLIQGNKIPIGYAKIENYPIHSGRMLSEEKDESGENKIFNIVDILSDMIPVSELGELAYKDSASGNYTPQGTVSQPTFTGSQATITMTGTPSGSVAKPTVQFIPTSKEYIMTTRVGTLPSLTYDSQTNTVTFSAGSLPTTENKNILIGGGCQVNGNLAFTGNEMTLTTTVTPQGTVSQPTFTGGQATITVE